MASAKRVTYFKAKIADQPGAMLALVKGLKAKNIGLVSLKGIGQGEYGEILAVAKNPDELRNEWQATGALVEEGSAIYISGADKTGALLANLDAIERAGVNIVAIEAVVAGGQYGTVLWVAPVDLEKTVQALGIK
jgi:hypothetical protein